MIADSFTKQGLELYFYKREDGTLEEDFFMRGAHSLIPVETKSRNGHSKSLKALIEGGKYPDVSWGIKLGDTNIGDSGTIKTFPLFPFLFPQGLPEQPQMTAPRAFVRSPPKRRKAMPRLELTR